jgi:hypothetical protein
MNEEARGGQSHLKGRMQVRNVSSDGLPEMSLAICAVLSRGRSDCSGDLAGQSREAPWGAATRYSGGEQKGFLEVRLDEDGFDEGSGVR